MTTVYALGELAVMYPVSGGFYTYSTRFIDPSWGFAMGWNYVFQWAIVLPLELVVAGFTVGYWNSEINVAVWITVFLVAIVIINVFGVLGFAEEEFWSSVLKLSAVVIFMIIGLILGMSLSDVFPDIFMEGLKSTVLASLKHSDRSTSPRWWAKQRHLLGVLGCKALV